MVAIPDGFKFRRSDPNRAGPETIILLIIHIFFFFYYYLVKFQNRPYRFFTGKLIKQKKNRRFVQSGFYPEMFVRIYESDVPAHNYLASFRSRLGYISFPMSADRTVVFGISPYTKPSWISLDITRCNAHGLLARFP